MALASSFVATHVYYANLGEEVETAVDESVAWKLVGGLSAGWGFFFMAFLMLMKKGFRSTFFSTQTGYQWTMSLFLEGRHDSTKRRVLVHNKRHWAAIRDDVKAWTLENWERWEEEKPEFFNDAFKATVDDDMIPAASLRKLNGAGSMHRSRRRTSLGDLMLGSGGGTGSRRRSNLGSSIVGGGGGAEIHPVA